MNGKFFLIIGSFLWITVASAQTSLRDTHERLNGLLWMQTSAEYRVLVNSTYRTAWSKVEKALADVKGGRLSRSAALEQRGWNVENLPLAVIIDIDETVLDNSPMSGELVTERKGYDPSIWSKWVSLRKAEFVGGAKEFIENARRANVEVFFVTNRTDSEEADTIEDLKPLDVTDDQILASKETGPGESAPWESEKSARRAFIARTHWIIAMVGDDLADFIPRIKSLPPGDRITESDKYADRFNNEWFLLPNPLYGSWESVLYDRNGSDEQQLKEKIQKVIHY